MVLSLTKLMEGIDTRRLEDLRRKYPDGPTRNPNWLKFCDWHNYGNRAIERVNTLGLMGCSLKDILDIGCGFGYFVRACSLTGHRIHGLDHHDAFYNDVWKVLDIDSMMIRHSLCVGRDLPVEPGSVDLITMFGFGLPQVLMENGQVRSALDWREYEQALRMLLKLLRPGGLFCALLNYGREWLFKRTCWTALASSVHGSLSGNENLFRIHIGA